MKRLFLLFLLAFGLATTSQAQAIQLKITVDVGLMQNPDCWLNQGVVTNNKVYMHSGLCFSDPQFCADSTCNPGSDIWQTVIGNWGLDDGVGLMTFEGNNKWSITLIPTSYFNEPAATPYSMGLVFRSSDGLIEGKDNACSDIFIKGINTTTPTVVGCDNQPFAPVTVERSVLAGVKEASYLGGLVMSPNPFRDRLNIDYNLQKKADAFSVKVFNGLGQEVITLASGSQVPGSHRLTWDGRTAAGQVCKNGLYYMVMSNGNQMIATEKMLLMR